MFGKSKNISKRVKKISNKILENNAIPLQQIHNKFPATCVIAPPHLSSSSLSGVSQHCCFPHSRCYFSESLLMKFVVRCLFWKIMVSTINCCRSFIVGSLKKIHPFILNFLGKSGNFSDFFKPIFSQLFY